MCESGQGQVDAEIEVTPEMVKAGVDEYLRWESGESYRIEDLVRNLYRRLRFAAMRDAPKPQFMAVAPWVVGLIEAELAKGK